MEMTFPCPQCRDAATVPNVEHAERAECRCGQSRPLHTEALTADGLVACPWCATQDLYIQKDFPHGLGLGIVVAGFVVSTYFYAVYRPVAAMVVLLATAALDLLLYYRVPDVTICYRCLSQFRGPGSNPDGRHQPFDLAIGERYRQERLRIEELRRRAGSPARSAAAGDPPVAEL